MAEDKVVDQKAEAGKIGMLTQEQLQFALKCVIEKCGTGNGQNIGDCPMCRRRSTWTLGQHLLTPVVFAEGGVHLGGAIYPQIALSCGNCGNTQFLNAITLGILKSKPDGTLIFSDQIEEKKDVK